MSSHTNCTCCRHWRRVDLPSFEDWSWTRKAARADGSYRDGQIVALLPPHDDGCWVTAFLAGAR